MKIKIALFLFVAFFMSCSGGEKVYYIVIETEFGNMKAELYNSTPLHRDNIIKLAKDDYYDDLLFHRVMNGFMIQGGDPVSKTAAPGQMLGNGGPSYTIPAEIGAPHFKGALAAARTPDNVNPQKESSGSQFYVVHGRVQTRSMLESIGRQKGIQYSEAQIAKYESIGGTPMLDMDYTVFGELVEGMEVIDKIAAMPVDRNNRPNKDIKMKVRVTTK